MPELPEVETVCRVIRSAVGGKRITRVEVVPDSIVYGRIAPPAIEAALVRRTLREVGRRGSSFGSRYPGQARWSSGISA